MAWILKTLFTTATESGDDSWLPSVPKLLALAALVAAIGYSFTRPAVAVFDDVHDSEGEDEERAIEEEEDEGEDTEEDDGDEDDEDGEDSEPVEGECEDCKDCPCVLPTEEKI